MDAALLSYRKNIHSQNGEDGIRAEILRRLKISQGYHWQTSAAQEWKNATQALAALPRWLWV